MLSPIGPRRPGYRSIFTTATRRQRAANFEAYWRYTVEHDGEIREDEKVLTKKQQILTRFQSNPVRSTRPLLDAERFYRNHVKMQDDPRALDRKKLGEMMHKIDLKDGPAKFFPDGRVKYEENGRRVGAELCIVQWQKGRPVAVHPESIAAAKAIWPKS